MESVDWLGVEFEVSWPWLAGAIVVTSLICAGLALAISRVARSRFRTTVWEAVKDLGWLPLLLIGVSGFSILTILEKAVLFRDLQLIPLFQIPLNGYHRVINDLGLLVEPCLQPVITWLNTHWRWSLHLNPIWRSSFVLGMVVVAAHSRANWAMGTRESRLYAIRLLVAAAVGSIIGALAVGLLPLTNSWWVQGLVPATLLTSIRLSIAGLAASFAFLSDQKHLPGDKAVRQRAARDYSRSLLFSGTKAAGLRAAIAFMAAAALSLLRGFGESAGFVVFGASIALYGATELLHGIRRAFRPQRRAGLTMLGGFVAAGLILISNWVVTGLINPQR